MARMNSHTYTILLKDRISIYSDTSLA